MTTTHTSRSLLNLKPLTDKPFCEALLGLEFRDHLLKGLVSFFDTRGPVGTSLRPVSHPTPLGFRVVVLEVEGPESQPSPVETSAS